MHSCECDYYRASPCELVEGWAATLSCVILLCAHVNAPSASPAWWHLSPLLSFLFVVSDLSLVSPLFLWCKWQLLWRINIERKWKILWRDIKAEGQGDIKVGGSTDRDVTSKNVSEKHRPHKWHETIRNLFQYRQICFFFKGLCFRIFPHSERLLYYDERNTCFVIFLSLCQAKPCGCLFMLNIDTID